MRILMITSEFPPACGGIGWYVYYLSRQMAAHGHQISILQRGTFRSRNFGGFRIHSVKAGIFPLLNAFLVVAKARAFLKGNPHDMAIIHGTVLGAWLKDIPTLLVSHSLFAEARKNIYKGGRDFNTQMHILFANLYQRTEETSIRRAQAIAVVSYAMQNEIKKHYGANSFYVGNAVDTNMFMPDPDSNARGVLFPSLLRPGKGVTDAACVMRLLRAKGCDIVFRFINSGPMKRKLTGAIRRYSLHPVELIEPMEHARLTRVYCTSSIVFLPSYYEGLPNVALEGMSCGLPIVCTDAGGTKEAVRHRQSGFVHKIGDHEGMANSIILLDRDASLRRVMGKNGRRAALRDFTWERVGRRFARLMEAIL